MPPLPSSLIRVRIRAVSYVDDWTLRRYFRGAPNLKSVTRERIEEALRKLDLGDLITPEAPPGDGGGDKNPPRR